MAAALECAAATKYCASECLKEEDVKNLGPCIQLDMECSTVCMSHAQLMMIGGEHAQLLAEACEAICIACAQECEKHAHMEHCQLCAEICRRCAEECHKLEPVQFER